MFHDVLLSEYTLKSYNTSDRCTIWTSTFSVSYHPVPRHVHVINTLTNKDLNAFPTVKFYLEPLIP